MYVGNKSLDQLGVRWVAGGYTGCAANIEQQAGTGMITKTGSGPLLRGSGR